MRKVLTAAEMREVDRLTTERYATPSLLLMEQAAGAAARELSAHFAHDLRRKTFLILCGRGNNGGDGAALARALCNAGAYVTLVLFGRVEETKGDARTNFEMARRLNGFVDGSPLVYPLQFIENVGENIWDDVRWAFTYRCDAIVDALFGTGLTRPLEGIHARVVAHLDQLRASLEGAGRARPLYVSLDIPSGLDADSNTPNGPAVRADLTVTFTAPKTANVIPPASRLGGRLVVADIGSPQSLIDEAPSKLFLVEASDARAWLEATRYAPGSYKNTHGHALVVAGSRGMTGAAVLSADAAMAAGAGLVTLASPESALAAVAARLTPEVMTAALRETETGGVGEEASAQLERLAERASVVAVGPGLSRGSDSTRRFVRAAVERRTTPVVLDADGLNALAPWPAELQGTNEAPVILTPHVGEMTRLLGSSEAPAPVERARVVAEFAAAHGLFVVLKGERTLVAAPDGRVFIVPTGNAGLGTAGTGDTLTGIITGFLAQEFAGDRKDALAALVAAVYTAGLAGDLAAKELGMRTMVASDVRKHLGAAVRALDPEGETP